MIADYSKMQVGWAVARGVVLSACDRCHKPGHRQVAERSGAVRMIHVVEIERVRTKGGVRTRQTVRDFCRPTSPRK